MSNLHYSQVKAYFKDHDGIEDHAESIYRMTKSVIFNGTEYKPGFYFVDETWSDYIGPYENKEACKEARTRYAIHLEGGSS